MIESYVSKNISKDIYRKIGSQCGIFGVGWACRELDVRDFNSPTQPTDEDVFAAPVKLKCVPIFTPYAVKESTTTSCYAKVAYHKAASPERIESAILQKLFADALENMSDEQRADALREMNLGDLVGLAQGAVAAAIAAGRMGGFATYKIAVRLAHAVAKAILGRGLPCGASAVIGRGVNLMPNHGSLANLYLHQQTTRTPPLSLVQATRAGRRTRGAPPSGLHCRHRTGRVNRRHRLG
ncbi:ubiquinol-cytochrome C chaperone family protein [Burkholderia ubonensis]|uniref:ubiquinol-cytochrome C chaperone family protein n=1 Tax=Burkholderia ubonensis TaxID=101571 RepID=UPI0012BADE77